MGEDRGWRQGLAIEVGWGFKEGGLLRCGVSACQFLGDYVGTCNSRILVYVSGFGGEAQVRL